MRNTILFSLATIGVGTALWAQETAKPKTERVVFDDQTFWLAYQESNSDGRVKEYLPRGEKLESWTQLAAFYEFSQPDDPKRAVETFVELIKTRYPDGRFHVLDPSEYGDVTFSFVVWPRYKEFIEFNVFKYSKKEGGGVRAQQYALREYVEKDRFLRELKPTRDRLVHLMVEQGLSTINAEKAVE